MIKVKINSVNPLQHKYCNKIFDPNVASPVAISTIYQSLFESNVKLNEAVGELPATLMIQSSFLHCEIARTIEATIPDVAAGSTTLVATSNLVAPSP